MNPLIAIIQPKESSTHGCKDDFFPGYLSRWIRRTKPWTKDEALDDLKSQKKKILEEVMEKETYKTAKLILERFDPDSKKAKEFEPPSAGPAVTARPGQEIRQRTAAQRNLSPTPVRSSQGPPPQVPVSPGPTKDTSAPGGPPERTATPALSSNVLPRRLGSPATSVPGMGLHPPGPPLARPILPRERSALDRVVEYLVGDGPQNRYALICQQCFSHNGMALKEEFEYIAFRCAYCFFLNPARKTRPQAPRLPEFSFEKRQAVDGSSSIGPLPSGSVISSENQISEGGAIPQMSHFLSEISGVKSNWLIFNPNKMPFFLFLNPHPRTCLEMGAGGGGCHLPSLSSVTGDQISNSGMCPDWELNRQRFGTWADAQPTEPL
ncbi:PREDICTED: protein lunapark isoform X7 [Myotis brandtii]|uniref:protein lunapark isoform X7 n=1 Tax=Myotis brandtii TaxID=109478 RepID=UPI00070467C5|nr:PREDICTED: protein lunapark isoform X7 [Myotis brandtii]